MDDARLLVLGRRSTKILRDGKLRRKAPCPQPVESLDELHAPRGEVPEWSNGAVSKTVEPSRVPRVRIPVSPPFYYHKHLIINKILKILPPIYPPPWLGLSRNMSDKATFWAKNCFQRRGPATSATLLHEKPNDARGGPDRGGHQKYETGHSPDFPCVQNLRE
jgi:hypothetical protein